jgi:hypothetical protein
MDLRTIVLGGEHQWVGNPPATPEAVADLVAWSPVRLPSEYLGLLRLSDGGHASLSGYPSYSRIWQARTAVEYNRDYEIQRWLPGFVGFGDDGGPVIVGFDTRRGPPYPVRAVPFSPMEWASAVDVAADFEAFIRRMLSNE